jgi:hypothetical protein
MSIMYTHIRPACSAAEAEQDALDDIREHDMPRARRARPDQPHGVRLVVDRQITRTRTMTTRRR